MTQRNSNFEQMHASCYFCNTELATDWLKAILEQHSEVHKLWQELAMEAAASMPATSEIMVSSSIQHIRILWHSRMT